MIDEIIDWCLSNFCFICLHILALLSYIMGGGGYNSLFVFFSRSSHSRSEIANCSSLLSPAEKSHD